MSSDQVVDDPPQRLFGRDHLPLVLGVVALVTLAAFENRAVGTALPTMVREFDALGSFGLANAAPNASYLVSLAIAGLWADRRGPLLALRAGAITFALAQLLVGAAQAMPMVIAGRLLSGFAEGLLDVALMVLVARALPAVLRPRMFSLFAAMWILPSVAGPFLTGIVTEHVGWRWVFLGALVLLVPSWLLLRPTLRLLARTEAPERGEQDAAELAAWRTALPWAFAASGALFVLSWSGDQLEAHPAIAWVAILVSLLVLGVAAVRVMPAGTFTARRGLPAVVAVRGLGGAAFAGAGAYLPLLLTLLHDFSPSRAGVTLSITGVSWALGSWLQGREHGLPRLTVLRIGLTLMTAGIAGTSLLAWASGTAFTWAGLISWSVAGIGMGLNSSSVSVLTLDLSDATNAGRNSSAAQMAGTMSIATVFAVYGTLLAVNADHPASWVFGVIISTSAGLALAALLTSARVSPPEMTRRTDSA
ncbi:major facilitator superfamily MFS_1 [Kribbella flavida DSM 17836]|uniref:Major facilitator superfamily MFS_1 n=1 Tax=Kribbella flavida (strain DSM 17836 / JCM 10339 / NBRC 14399) TaxID=479435 RepID=D2PN64_KRIFD|nr:MFS transporter [Kribbella flavida]ADB34548.1 major facilitator superfamily MFS_1 [Kribbella flavida DSM 17836]